MRILEINSTNYRNLDGVTLRFTGTLDYIVGENNVGKSNVLILLDTLFNRATFVREDFKDPSQPIKATVKLSVDEAEAGVFGMLVDPDCGNAITIKAFCPEPNETIEFTHELTGDGIAQANLRSINFFKYATVAFDSRTLSFSSAKGVGRLLGSSVTRYREEAGKSVSDFFNQDEIGPLLEELNKKIENVPLLSSCGVSATVDAADTDALESVVTLTDENNVTMKSAGSGIQYVSLAILSVLQSLASLSKRRLDNSTFVVGGKKTLRGVIALDEPEIHLHPYMQRRLVRALTRISSGEDEGFNNLVHDLLGVDAFEGQVILVTHSPEILEKGNYSNIIRLGYENGILASANGVDISLKPGERKQLEAQFSKIREAFFARAAIIVEGQTDETALPEFARKLNLEPDELGILIIRADSRGSVPGVRGLLERFHIPCVSIVDRDGTEETSTGTYLVTKLRDFEEEYIESLFSTANQGVFLALLNEIDNRGRDSSVQKSKLEEAYKKLGYDVSALPSDNIVRFSIPEFDGEIENTPLTKAMMYAWLTNRKGVLMPRRLGEITPTEAIPKCYKDLLVAAMGLL